ncbi:hypothetical protein L7F22_000980 [Adiantum nelumboides]|nr:hypothetical protein [Adiantum nelumboides]
MACSSPAFSAFFFALFYIAALSSAAAQQPSQFEFSPSPSAPSPNASPLPPLPPGEDPDKFQLSLEVMWDGMVTARDAQTKEVRWLFSSGSPLNTAHGPVLDALEGKNTSLGIPGEPPISDDEFVFCSTDWKLYSFDKKHGIQVLPVPPHELVQNTPTVLDGSIILGSMTTSVFVLDAKSGSLVQTFDSRNQSFTADHVGEEDIWRFLEELVTKPSSLDYLFLLRRDYSIKSVSLAEGTLLWNVSVADVRLHHINPDSMLQLPGSGEKRLAYIPALQPVALPAALPGGHGRNVAFPLDKKQDFLQSPGSSYIKTTIVAVILVLFGIFIPLLLWIKSPPKQTGKKRRAKKKPVPPTTRQEPARITSDASDNVASVNSSSPDLQMPSYDTNSVETILGRLRVQNAKHVGYGSNGTIVFEGFLGERPVAVKRMLTQYYDKAQKEINNLIKSDEHPNILRYYHVESDAHFVYVALERCRFSLNDLVIAQSIKRLGLNKFICLPDGISKEEVQVIQEKVGDAKDCQLWDDCYRPSAKLLQLMSTFSVEAVSCRYCKSQLTRACGAVCGTKESPYTKSDSTDDGLEAGEEKKEPQPLDIEEKKEPKAEPDIEKPVADVQVDHEEVETKEVPNNSWEMQAKESQEEKEKVEGEEQNPDEEVGSEEEPRKEGILTDYPDDR